MTGWPHFCIAFSRCFESCGECASGLSLRSQREVASENSVASNALLCMEIFGGLRALLHMGVTGAVGALKTHVDKVNHSCDLRVPPCPRSCRRHRSRR